jgi:hypothetical protein
MVEPQDTAADRAAAGIVADETARLVEALGVWATSVSPTSGTSARPTSGTSARPTSGTSAPTASGTSAPAGSASAPEAPSAPTDTSRQNPSGTSDDHAPDDSGARDGSAAEEEPRSEASYGVGRCGHCGAETGVGRTVSCQVCPICQGIALLRTVRPETVDRLADVAGAVAATLREVAAHVRTGAHQPGAPADGASRPGGGGPGAGRTWAGQAGRDGWGAPGGPATVQDIPVDDGDSSDEGDEW